MAVTARKLASAPHLLLEFDWSDVPSVLPLGTVLAGGIVECVVVEVFGGFDSAVTVEVGRSSAPAELMLGTDSNLAVAGRYRVATDHLYLGSTALIVTLLAPGLPPTLGAGRVLIYLN